MLDPFIHQWMRVNTMLPIVLPMWNSINIFSNEKQNQAPFSISIRFCILHLFVYICKLKHFTSYTVKCISSVLQRTFCSIRAQSECIIGFNCYFFYRTAYKVQRGYHSLFWFNQKLKKNVKSIWCWKSKALTVLE